MYEAKKYDTLIGTEGFSEALLKNHFTLYEGYVKNTNTLVEKLDAMAKEGKGGTPEYNELKRRFGWEWNGMRMHELYFGNMKKGGVTWNDRSLLAGAIEKRWGNYGEWAKDFKSTGAMRGIGWVVLATDKVSGALFNIWVNEHDAGHLVGTTPLLVMDVFEHAFMLDYGLSRTAYIDAFWNSIDWGCVENRLSQ